MTNETFYDIIKSQSRGGETKLNFIQTITNEMTKGNFSFAILIVGIIQIIIMLTKKK